MASDVSDNEHTSLCFTRYLRRDCVFTWKIHRFSKLKLKTGECLVSDTFYHSLEEERKFSLECYPKGESKKASEYISLFLFVNAPQEKLFIDGIFRVFDKNRKAVQVRKMQHNFRSGSGWGYQQFFLINRLDEVLSEDILTLSCTVTSYSKENNYRRISKQKNFDCARYEALSNDLKKLFEEQSFSDAVIKLRESEFKACRNILSHRSSFLDSLFKLNVESAVIEISEMEKDTFAIFLQYLYTAELPKLSIDLAKSLLVASETYKVPALKQSCFDYLGHVISVDTVCDILTLAIKHGGSELTESCIKYFQKNQSSMCSSNDWKTKLSLHPKVIASLIESVTEEISVVEKKSCVTQTMEHCFSLKWTICGLSKCQLNPQEYLESSPFDYSEEDDLRVSVFLYPKGREEEDSDYISLGVVPNLEIDDEIRATLGIINDEHKLKNISTISLGDTYYCDRFIERSELFKNKHLLIDDSVTIYCKVHVFIKKKTSSVDSALSSTPPTRYASLSEDLSKLYKSKYLADVTFKLGDIEFKAHKNILSARSCVFEAMFKSDMRESESNLVEIPDLEPQHFEVLLRYLYTANLPPLTFQLAKSLLIMSDKYDVPCLKSECVDYLKCVVSVANVSEVVLLADMLNEPELKQAAMDLIRDNWAFVTDWKEKLSSRPELLADLLEEAMKHNAEHIVTETN